MKKRNRFKQVIAGLLSTAMIMSSINAPVLSYASNEFTSGEISFEEWTDDGNGELFADPVLEKNEIFTAGDVENGEENVLVDNEAEKDILLGKASELIATEGTCGDNLTWKLSEEGTLTICGTGEMSTGYSFRPWFENRREIINIVIKEGVTSIGNYAFSGCSSLVNVEIPSGVTSIDNSAFKDCSSLINVEIPSGVTSIDNSAFSGCSSLISVEIPSGVTSIGGDVFRGCSSLINVEIPSGVTSIGSGAFKDCISLTDVEIPSGVISIGGFAFDGCRSLTSIGSIPEGITSIGDGVFSNCSSLTSIKLPVGVTSIGSGAFSGCSSMEEISIPSGVISIGDSAFSGCSSLINVEIPNGVTSIDNSAFNGCSSMEEISIPSGVTSIGIDAFCYCSSLVNVEIPSGVTSIGNYAFRGCSSLINVEIPSGVTSIGTALFSNCSSLTSIKLPAGVTSIGGGAFSGCRSLTSIDIPDGVTMISNSILSDCSSLLSIKLPAGVTSISNYAFSGCSSLINVEIASGVTSIGDGVFSNCSSLTSIKLPAGLTSIGSDAFKGCSSLINVEIASGVTSIGDSAFFGCSSLVNVEIPSGVTSIGSDVFFGCSRMEEISIPNGVTSIGSGAFSYCSSLINVEIASGVTSIGNDAFSYCSSLINVEIASGVTSIGSAAFNGCSSMEEISIPSRATGIGDYTFVGCSSLINVEIPSGVTSIGEYAFKDCISLTDVEIPSGVTSIGRHAFNNCYCLSSIEIASGVTSIGEYAFNYCSSLVNVEIPSGVTSIGSGAFKDCISLTDVEIPSGVTSIGDYTFIGCIKLKIIYFGGTEEEWSKLGINYIDDVTIYYNSTNPENPDPENPEAEISEYVRYFSSWDAEDKIAYWGQGDFVGSTITDETDTSFLGNIDNLVGRYVLAKTKPREDSMVAPDTLISIKPVQSRTGMVSAIDSTSVTINGSTYPIANNVEVLIPEFYLNNKVLYHLLDGEIVGIEALKAVMGTLNSWDSETGTLTMTSDGELAQTKTYKMSWLSDSESVAIGDEGDYFKILVDDMNFFYETEGATKPDSEDIVFLNTPYTVQIGCNTFIQVSIKESDSLTEDEISIVSANTDILKIADYYIAKQEEGVTTLFVELEGVTSGKTMAMLSLLDGRSASCDVEVKNYKSLMPKNGFQFAELTELNCEITFNSGISSIDNNKYAYLMSYDDDKIIDKVLLSSCKRDYDALCLTFNEDKNINLSVNKKYYILIDSEAIEFDDGTLFYGIQDKDEWCLRTSPVEYSTIINKDVGGAINPLLFDKIFDPIKALSTWLVNNGTDGICYGFCYAAAAWDKGYPGIKSIGKNKKLQDLLPTDCGDSKYTFLEYLQLAHAYQFSDVVQNQIVANKNQYENLHQAIREYEINKKQPIIIHIKFYDNVDNKMAGHGLYPIGIISEDKDSVEIAVYDCVHGPTSGYISGKIVRNFVKTLRLEKTGGKITKWKYGSYEPREGNEESDYISFSYVDQIVDNIIAGESGAKSSKNLIHSDIPIEGMDAIDTFAGKGSAKKYNLYWTDESKVIRVGKDNENISELGITDGYDSISVSTSLMNDVTIDLLNTTAQVTHSSTGECGEYAITYWSMDDDLSDKRTIIEGIASGNIKTEKTEEGIHLFGDGFNDVTITRSENGEIETLTTSTDKDEILIVEEESGSLEIYVDADGDGEFETDITKPHVHSYACEITTHETCATAGIMTYTCACGDTYTEEIPATGQHITTVVVDKPATYDETGIQHEECTVCNWKGEDKVIPVIERPVEPSPTVTPEPTPLPEPPTEEEKASIEDALTKSENYNKDNYSEETWKKFEDAVKAAEEGLKDSSLTKDKAEELLKNLQDALAEMEKIGIPDIKKVVVEGNKATVILDGKTDAAEGYDFVISKDKKCTVTRNYRDIRKNITDTKATFSYVQRGYYYVYCHAWKKVDGKKAFGSWSAPYKFKVTATTVPTPKITSVTVKGRTVTVKIRQSKHAVGADIILGTKIYKDQYCTRPVNYGKMVKKNQNGTTITFTNVPKGTYYVGVHSYNRTGIGGRKVFSRWSEPKKIKVR